MSKSDDRRGVSRTLPCRSLADELNARDDGTDAAKEAGVAPRGQPLNLSAPSAVVVSPRTQSAAIQAHRRASQN